VLDEGRRVHFLLVDEDDDRCCRCLGCRSHFGAGALAAAGSSGCRVGEVEPGPGAADGLRGVVVGEGC
jgi:phage tail tape-measure protein